ncbi:MAG: TIGR00282 family metallophosphoesterase [Patescibacteria group bacterium]|nr:TIGR00282 family metallophosphoesterase [Patescibacteria group bacterium]
MITVLFLGDVVGKIGRHALAQALPDLRRETNADLVIANGENVAHGNGITESTFRELITAGVDVVTLGDHAFDRREAEALVVTEAARLLRPANYPPSAPGSGAQLIAVGSRQILLVSLVGRVFMKMHYDCPFRTFDAIWERYRKHKLSGVIVDFHAEATSEKQAFAWHVDGRASVVLGTHTHVPTADLRRLPGGTGLVCDVGMVGARDSVIGVKPEGSLQSFLRQTPALFEPVEDGPCLVNGVVVTLDPHSGRLEKITRLDREVVM